MANRVLIDATTIAGVAFNGVDDAVFDLLDDANMIGLTILWAGAALIIPIEEDDHSGRRLDRVVRPLISLLEPVHTVDTSCELWNDTGVDIAAFVRTPADETGAPLHTAAEAVP